MGSFEDWKRQREADDDASGEEDAPRSEETPPSDVAPPSEIEPESRAGTLLGRFEVAERTPQKLVLLARTRSDTFAIKWAVVVVSVLFPIGCALSTYAVQPAPLMAAMFGGITLSILFMVDFARVSTSGRFVMVERSLEISGARPDGGYREGARNAIDLVVDLRKLDEPVVDVKLLTETVPQGHGQVQVHRVYIVLERTIVSLEATKNRLAAMRLAGLARNALGLEPLQETSREVPTLGGCAMVFVVVMAELAVVAGGTVVMNSLGNGMSRHDHISPLLGGLVSAAMVVGMFVVQHLCAIPMSRAVEGHVRQNLGA